MSCGPLRYDSWLHTRVKWQPVSFDIGSVVGKAAIFPFIRGRLPWEQDLTRLIVTVRGDELGIYKFQEVPEVVQYTNALFLSKVYAFAQIGEMFAWPDAEAIYDGFVGEDVCDLLPTPAINKRILDRWHEKNIGEGWWPVARGALGLSFVRDLEDGNCLEVQGPGQNVLFYLGPIAMNEALLDHRVTRFVKLHAVDQLRAQMSDDDYIQLRLLLRYLRVWIWELAYELDLPF